MALTFHVDIVSAEEEIFSGTAEMLFAPASMGEVGIMARHAPFMSPLKPGEVRIKLKNGEEQNVYVSGGLLEVQPHVVTVLADTAIRAKDLDEAAAIEAKERAEKALHDKQADIDYALAEAELAEAVAQLHAIQRMKKRAGR
ncbi:MAG: F0F1 ATP synthase subunit epsilon [Gammaproteobacteria bacterium]|nr:F0F1 ATP synthase subunit epsilon [Gammaproteobacteria bacterium]MDH5728601.1 F0F1 ATP synthase subunit epsilon [Gammaproteobacteria bacterium]